MRRKYFPSLRGTFGDWVYYACLVPLPEISSRVNFADEIHKSKKLSQMIQRELKKKRAKEIANYLLNQKERFFNSLVVAVYGGEPSWHGVSKISAQERVIKPQDVEDTQGTVGFLSFSGKEKLFAIDGQHRLAGIKEVMKRHENFSEDLLPVIFVAHTKTKSGLQRTRRLFTTLNKTAKPVSKGETIALDEDDVMAIIARRLVEEHGFFSEERIAVNASNNLAVNDFSSLTTIGNLYDILQILFTKIQRRCRASVLKLERPNETELNSYYQFASDYFGLLSKYFRSLYEFFQSKDCRSVVRKCRGDFGGNVMFRPIGLTMMTEVIEKIGRHLQLDQSVQLAASLPQQLEGPPYADVLWDTRKHIMINAGRALSRDLLLHCLGYLDGKKLVKLGKDYAKALGQDPKISESLLKKLVANVKRSGV
jgi:DNA sulfur modification protein DndB